MTRFPIETSAREQLVDITADVERIVGEGGVREGVAHVFCVHTTAGVTINENADPDVVHDLISALSALAPAYGEWRHAEGNSDAHVKASLVGASASVPVSDGGLVLGRWQALYFCEFDGPRSRSVVVTVTPC